MTSATASPSTKAIARKPAPRKKSKRISPHSPSIATNNLGPGLDWTKPPIPATGETLGNRFVRYQTPSIPFSAFHSSATDESPDASHKQSTAACILSPACHATGSCPILGSRGVGPNRPKEKNASTPKPRPETNHRPLPATKPAPTAPMF